MWLKGALLGGLVGRLGDWQLDQAVFVVNEIARKRIQLLDQVFDAPETIYLLTRLFQRTWRVLAVVASKLGQVFVPQQSLDVVDECLSLCNKLLHALLQAIPIRVDHEFEEDVENASFDPLSIAERI